MRTHNVSLPIANRATKADSSGSEKPGFWAIELGGWRHMPMAQQRRLSNPADLASGIQNPHWRMLALPVQQCLVTQFPLFPGHSHKFQRITATGSFFSHRQWVLIKPWLCWTGLRLLVSCKFTSSQTYHSIWMRLPLDSSWNWWTDVGVYCSHHISFPIATSSLWSLSKASSKMYLFMRPHCMACGMLVPIPGIEPASLQRNCSLNHWAARGVPQMVSFYIYLG